jgi:RNA polymerase sigma-70 factor, ECF subfamily
MEFNESEIIAECKAGNWLDFDKIYDFYLPKIYQYVYYRIRHKQTTEDLTSTIFLKTVQNLHSFRSEGAPFGAWLYRIAHNTVIDHTRSHKSTQDLETAAEIPDPQNIMADTDIKLKLDTLKASLEGLNDQQREILTLRVWDELSHKEISQILEISEGASKVAYSRAVTALKQRIDTI